MAVASPVYDPFAIGSKKSKTNFVNSCGSGLEAMESFEMIGLFLSFARLERTWSRKQFGKRKVTGVEITMNRMERKSKRGEIAVRQSSERNG